MALPALGENNTLQCVVPPEGLLNLFTGTQITSDPSQKHRKNILERNCCQTLLLPADKRGVLSVSMLVCGGG